jgi:23S rRNA G2069 N7-methylase RlmK/C1962 C5-methylase RlmI
VERLRIIIAFDKLKAIDEEDCLDRFRQRKEERKEGIAADCYRLSYIHLSIHLSPAVSFISASFLNAK